MKTKSLKSQLGTFLVIIIFLAMFLVSLVWGMFLKKNVVDNEILKIDNLIEIVQEKVKSLAGRSEADLLAATVSFLQTRGIQCFSLKTQDGRFLRENKSECSSDALFAEIETETLKRNHRTITYHGTSWAIFTFAHRQVLVGKPLLHTNGETIGVIVIGASLEPVYAKIREQSKVVLFYIVINTIIFAGIGLLRMMQIFMKPIERFTMLSKQYSPSSVNLFREESDNEFTNLSHSLNSLFTRIREDNENLRKTVALLESANIELERNKSEMVRTEKLAAIGRLSAGLAHEIGNPLSIILGYVELLRRHDLSTDERELFSNNSQLELQRIKNLIRQLLDFSRSEALPDQPVSVNELIEQLIEFGGMEKSFAKCHVVLRLDAINDEIITQGDSLRQVLLNCMLNAVDSLAESEGGGEIIVSTSNSGDKTTRDVLVISIIDNGTGIAKEHLVNVFDPFFTTKEVGQGTGLGLFVCHTIVERLGGSIVIHNNPEGEMGSEVIITLPLAEELPVKNNGQLNDI